MSGVRFSANTTPTATTGTTKKTILQIAAAADHRCKVDEISVSFGGTDNTAEPVLVEIIRQGDAGSGGIPLPVVKINESDDESLEVTALEDISGTTQPTDVDVIFSERVHPQGGYTWQAPFGKELPIKGGTRLGIAVTAEADVEVEARITGDE